MAIPANKGELLRAITDNYAKLSAELATIPVELTDAKELDGHAKDTPMSVSDLVAYLVGWGRLVLKWNDRRSRGLDVDFPETGFKWNELGRLAQKFYADLCHGRLRGARRGARKDDERDRESGAEQIERGSIRGRLV